MEQKGSLFSLNGLSGFLIMVVLLLSIWVFLILRTFVVEQQEAENFYYIKYKHAIEMNSKKTSEHKIFVTK